MTAQRSLLNPIRLAADASGTAVTEFVIVAPLFLALFLGILEIGLQFYFAAAAEKAAQLGVRTAVVVTPPTDVPAINDSPGSDWGAVCTPAGSPCTNFGAIVCTGSACGGGFDRVLARMQAMLPVLADTNITLRYEYVGLGFAGGPIVPSVTLTITGLQWPAGPFAAVVGLLGGSAGATTLPPIRATLTGEDLAT